MKWIIFNWESIATYLLIASESLALIPKIKSNSVFQVITNLLRFKKP